MSALTIRSATVADSEAVAAIYAHYVQYSVATFDTVAPEPATWAATVRDGALPFRVGEVDGAITGFAYLSPYRPKAAYRHTAEDTVYVAPQCLGRGYGRLLLADLLERAASTDLQQLIAVIADGGDGASERLHAALGFTVVGRLTMVGRKFDRWIDTVLMQRDVPR